MVKVTSLVATVSGSYRIEAFADTKEEVTDSTEFVGFPENGTMEAGSSIITADGEIALLKSDGTWNWIED